MTGSTNISGSAKGTFRVRVLPLERDSDSYAAWVNVETYGDLDSALRGQMEFVKSGRLKEGEKIKVVRGKRIFYQPSDQQLFFWRNHGREMRRSQYK